MAELKQAVRDLQIEMGGEREEGRRLDTLLTSEDRRRLNALLLPETAAAPTKAATARR